MVVVVVVWVAIVVVIASHGSGCCRHVAGWCGLRASVGVGFPWS